MVDMVAKRRMTYAGRRYNKGDALWVKTNRDARVLAAVGRAEYGLSAEENEQRRLESMRAEYEGITGGSANPRWKAETLERKIEEAIKENGGSSKGGTYRRRDMRAED